MVGIPGRIVMPVAKTEENGHRAKIARRYGFDAYAISSENPDPVANAIGLMLDHVHLIDTKVEEMCKEINNMGGSVCGKSLPTLEIDSFDEHLTTAEKESAKASFDPQI